MTRKIKVALIGPVPPPAGGIASWTLRMLSSDIAAKDIDFIHIDESVSAGREIFGLEAKRSLPKEFARCRRIWNDLENAIIYESAELVHANIPAAPLSMLRELVCAMIANRHNIPFVIHFRCTVPVYASNPIALFLLKSLLIRSSAVVVLNEASKVFVEKMTDTPVYLIPNFISSEELALAVKSAHSYNGSLSKVLYTGGIIESKGAYDILEIAKAMPEIEFRLAGKGGFPGDAVIPKNIRILGQLSRESICAEYKKADAFIFLSRFRGEGFSNSLAEAMAFALPCIVSDWAANADMIRPNGGIVVDYRSINSVVQSLKYLNSPNHRREMGRANQKKVMELYSEDVVMYQYLKLYRLLSGK